LNRQWKQWNAGLALALFVSLSGAARAADNYEINVILPQTGRASFLGKGEIRALELVQKAVNAGGGIGGRPLKFTYFDDQSSPQTALQLTNQVLASRPAVVIGPTIIAQCNAVAPLVQQNGPLLYCLSPGIKPAKGSHVFSASVSTRDLQTALIRYFRLKGWTRVAVITSSDASGQEAEEGINAVMSLPENKDMKLVAGVRFDPSDISVSAQIERIKAAQPQFVIAWSTGAAIATVFKGMVQAGLNLPVVTTHGNMTYAQMKQYAAFLPKELYFPAPLWAAQGANLKLSAEVKKAQDEFYAAYRAENEMPDETAELAWGPAMLLVDALRKLGANATGTQIRDYLMNLKGHPSINGEYDFVAAPQRGMGEKNGMVVRWDAAKQVWETMSQPTGIPLAK